MTKHKRKTMPVQQVETSINVATRQLLEAGAIVLGSRWEFTDAEQAEWIEATVGLAKTRILTLAETIKGINERAKANGK
jgi:hypothetical protein